MMNISRIKLGFKIMKTNNGPDGLKIPYMTQYYLTDDNNNKLSFWNDLPIDLHGDIVNACI
jgi:hypothetical protein